MLKVLIKTPKPLQKAEIIRSRNVKIDTIPAFVPFSEMGADYYTPRQNEEYKVESLKDLILETDTEFFQSFKISNLDQPVQLTLDRLPEQVIRLAEAQQEVQDAYDKGFEDAKELMKSTINSEIDRFQQRVKNFDSAVTELRSIFYNEIGKLEAAVIPIAIMCAEHILQREINSGSGVVIEQTRKALREIDNEVVLKIHLNPVNVNTIEEVKKILSDDPSKIENALIVADESVDLGGCILESTAGIIDARIKTQLEKLQQSLNNISMKDNS